MKIFGFTVLENHEWILPPNPSVYEMLYCLNGAVGSSWVPPTMEIVHEDDDGKPRIRSDFPWLGEHAPILRPRAINALQTTLEAHGELLPLNCAEPVWLFNATRIIDALDQARSQIVRFEDGDILNIERYSFDPIEIGDHMIFRLPIRSSPVFVTEAFVSQISAARLEGVAFRLLWSNEAEQKDETLSFPGQAGPASHWRSFWAAVIMGILRKPG